LGNARGELLQLERKELKLSEARTMQFPNLDF
jgi:hypothetical protein